MKTVRTFLGLLLTASVGYGQNVGIGTATPTQRLDVNGNVQFSGALMPGGNPGTAGQVLTSQGANTPPIWVNPTQLSGWRLIYVDDFDDGTAQGWSGPGAAPSTCGMWRLLGGYNNCGTGCNLTKTYNLTGIPHSKVMVKVYWVKIDSWDQNTSAGRNYWTLSIDGNSVGGGAAVGSDASDSEGTNTICGANGGSEIWVEEGPFVSVGVISHSGNSVQVNIVSNLDQAATDESLGIDAVEVWVY